jgi:hypothetical protein
VPAPPIAFAVAQFLGHQLHRSGRRAVVKDPQRLAGPGHRARFAEKFAKGLEGPPGRASGRVVLKLELDSDRLVQGNNQRGVRRVPLLRNEEEAVLSDN